MITPEEINKVYYEWLVKTLHSESMESEKQQYEEVDEWCALQSQTYWKDRFFLKCVSEIRNANRQRYVDICSEVISDKIEWRKKGIINEGRAKTNRSEAPVGDIQWRQGGFKKQTISA